MVSISGSAHLQGRLWVDMSGWREGSEDKGEVCVKCEWVGGVGWGPQGSGFTCSNTHKKMQSANAHLHTQHTHTCTHTIRPFQDGVVYFFFYYFFSSLHDFSCFLLLAC